MYRRDPESLGQGPAASQSAPEESTPHTLPTTGSNGLSGVNNSPSRLLSEGLPNDPAATSASRNTSYASIPIPDDDDDDNSTSPLPTPIPPSRPKWTRPIVSAVASTWRFVKGPIPPRKTYIKPFFPHWQSAPSRLLYHNLPKSRHRRLLQIVFWIIWLIIFSTIIHWSRFRTNVGGVLSNTDGGGVHQLTCLNSLWWRNNGCGLNGITCTPFTSNTAIPFRCPSGCVDSSRLLSPRQVGNRTIIFRQMVVGGPGPDFAENEVAYDQPYRADSFICAAAVHAGVTTDTFGGCGLLLPSGATSFPPGLLGSERHGISSVGFDTSFPKAYTFVRPPPGTKMEGCLDLRWHLLPISSLFTFIQAIFSTHSATLVGTLFTAIFWHVGMASDPPPPQINHNDQYEVVSLVVGRFLPAAFIVYIFYLHVLGPTWVTNISPLSPNEMNKPKPPFRLPSGIAIERATLLLLGWWFGALNNLTFAKLIPLARLTPRDLATQPGAKPALAIVLIILVCIAVGQIYFFRREGRLPRYLALYLSFASCLLLFVFALKDMALRIHHYILALLLLPGTKLGTRLSMVYQGLLLGLFVNGTARWGFASIIETKGILLGEGVYGNGGVPTVLPPSGGNVTWEYDPDKVWQGNWYQGVEALSDEKLAAQLASGGDDGSGVWWQNVTIRWHWPTADENTLFDRKTGLPIEGTREWDGISLIINDVERYQGFIPEAVAAEGDSDSIVDSLGAKDDGDGDPTVGSFTWSRRSLPKEYWDDNKQKRTWENLYVRIAYTTSRNSRGVGDYTRPGVVGYSWPSASDGQQGGWIPPPDGRT